MARPIADKYVMRTPEEKEAIVLEALERGTKRTAEVRGVDRRLLQRWIAKYRADGVDGLTSRTGKKDGGGGRNPLAGLQSKKNKTREEELELENLMLRIEVARLKKGYQVKGGGREKEYVTTKGSNSRS